MADKIHFEAQEKKTALLEQMLDQQKQHEAIITFLFKISHAVNTASTLEQLFESIHLSLGSVIDTTNFYIALYEKLQDSVSFPYIVDTVDKNYPPVIAISKIESLTAEVIRTQAPVFAAKDDVLDKRARSTLKIPSCTPAEIWLGVPLKTGNELVGVMAVQSYTDPNCYKQDDVELLVAVAELVALVIKRKQVEQALWEREKQFRGLIEESMLGILIHREHRPLFVNDKWAQIHGYSREDILKMETVTPLIGSEDRERMIQYKEYRMQGKAVPEDYEYQGVHKDGSLLWLENRVSIVKWEGQEAIQTTIVDITGRKNAEAERERLIIKLETALNEVKTLQGIIPICMHCKEIRDDEGFWNRLELYIESHSQAQFSHSICDKCLEKLYPDVNDEE